ncbi:MAG: LysR substrate-binding domain-containing protein [Bacteroidota bacterium]
MTITQLEYIVAVADCKSFAKAAEKCHITQPTLSVQIKKLEDDLKVVLFDRSKKPVRPTDLGMQIIEQARISLGELGRIRKIAASEQEDNQGLINLGIIPTLSPYLLPLFSMPFLQHNPDSQLIVKEMISNDVIYNLYNHNLDIGILSTPIDSPDLKQLPLFYEPFVLYLSEDHPLIEQTQVHIEDLNLSELWLLEEGHCFRNQAFNICGKNRADNNRNALRIESGSLEALRRIVERQFGYTLLPQLATLEFNEQQKKRVKTFAPQTPVREISLIINRQFMKRKVVESLRRAILSQIPEEMQHKEGKQIIEWE